MMRSDGFTFSSALENDVTEKLEDMLENRIRNRDEIEGFDSLFFGKVTRANEVVNFDGTKKSKKPDLVFALRRENRTDWDQRQDALFAECKPVDKKHKLSAHYCAVGTAYVGIERFIIGHYAWAMEEGLMIGYVQDGLTVLPHLADALIHPEIHKKLGSPECPAAVAENNLSSGKPLYHTRHQRLFCWQQGPKATPIDLYHSWHNCG